MDLKSVFVALCFVLLGFVLGYVLSITGFLGAGKAIYQPTVNETRVCEIFCSLFSNSQYLRVEQNKHCICMQVTSLLERETNRTIRVFQEVDAGVILGIQALPVQTEQ